MSYYEDEIDLRPHILALIKGWWKVVLIAFVLASVTLAFTISQPRTYQATATVVLTRSQLRLSLAEQFPTVSDSRDDPSRKDAFLAIARSDSIAQEIYNKLGDQAQGNYDSFASLKESVEINSVGDAIQVTAEAKNPNLAAEIANTWAQETNQAINLAYSGEQPLSEIQNQITSTKQAYQEAQSDLGSFIRNNKIVLLENQIAEAQTLLNTITQDRTNLIEYYDNRKLLMTQLKLEAGALIEQLNRGNQSSAGETGIALAVLVSNANTFGYESGVNLDIQLADLSTIQDSELAYQGDLDLLIQQAEEEILKADEQLTRLSQEVVQGETSKLADETATQLQELEAQLESETAFMQELTSDRDLAWEAYQALLEKETEIKTASQANVEVALASQAIPPQEPTPRGTIRNTMIAGILGGMLAVFWILANVWWRSSDLNLSPNDKTTKPSDNN
ncbi:MAG: Wzz/FepE/Etk N-terminal domain-containing protein [Anaerolineales bacterium]|jgi:capsular polysaccharide biosynthesis protein